CSVESGIISRKSSVEPSPGGLAVPSNAGLVVPKMVHEAPLAHDADVSPVPRLRGDERAGSGIDEVIMRVRGMVNRVASLTARAPFQAEQLRVQAGHVEEFDPTGVQEREERPVDTRLRLRTLLADDAVCHEPLAHPSPP